MKMNDDNGLEGFSDLVSKFTDTITDIAPKYAEYKTQRSIRKMQMERARKGLKPIDTAHLSPTIRIQPELPPEMLSAGKSYMKVVVPVLLGIGLLLFLRKK